MLLSLILGLIIGGATVIFALQNVFTVTVTFLSWELTASLAILIILSVLVGVLISLLMTIPGTIKNSFVIGKLKRENKKLTEELATAHQATTEVKVVATEVPII